MKGDSPSAPLSAKLHPADWVVQAGAVDEVLEAMEARLSARRHRRRLMLGSGVAVALACVAVAWLVPYFRDTQTVSTRVAQRQTLTLADGTRADLNAQTALFTDFRGDRRKVRLDRGEAFFVVARNEEHPFEVDTPAGTVRVTGTEFNVRLVGKRAEVTLMEGGVVFAGRGDASIPVRLTPGQQLDTARPEVLTLTTSGLDRVAAWREGRVVFDGEPLSDAVARFAEFHGVVIDVEPRAAALRLGGSYRLHELKEFLSALETTLPVAALPRTDGSYRVVAQ